MSEKTDRNCMSDRVRDSLMSQILEGELKPGHRLIELELARQFDTSQTPIREALRELETLKLVESEPYRGTRVRAISDQEMLEAYTVRGVLEQLAGELAAPYLNRNSAALRTSVESLVSAAKDGDIAGYSYYNMEFHRGIVEASRNELLFQTWSTLAFEARVRIHLKHAHTPDLVNRALEHMPILEALDRGDGKSAGLLLRAHAESCRQRWQNRHAEVHDDKSSKSEGNIVHATVLS